MNLARHAAVLWRFRAVTASGLALGIVLAILASYQVMWDGGLSLVARGAETWSSESSMLVTQAGFPEGRVTLPTPPIGGAVDPTETDQERRDKLEFADPARFAALADLYAQLAVSDQVRGRVPERPKPTQIQAVSVQSTSGSLVLPVIKLTTFADSKSGARALNIHTGEALRGLLATEQSANDIAQRQRIQLSVLNAPSSAVLTAGRSHTASILALLLCLIGTVAVTHLLAALRDRRQVEALDSIYFPWSDDDKGEPKPEPEPEPEPVSFGNRRSSASERQPPEHRR